MKSRSYLRYLAGVGATVLLLATASLMLNLLVDPLWYAAGNRLTGVNYLFNERVAKSNLLLKAPEHYDCVIFGSSRTTLLNPHEIEGYDCFNYAFSLGQSYEYVRFAAYAKAFGLAPKLVIVGVDGEDFLERTDGYNIPAFVEHGERPPSPITSYLSPQAVEFSLQTLFGESPLSRYSRADFTVDLIRGIDGDHRRPAVDETGAPHQLDSLVHYEQLREIFPDATFVGYVPPISPIRVEVLDEERRLQSYLDAIYHASRLFDRFYDFSVPNRVTASHRYTHDGSHYVPSVNAAVAAIISGDRPTAMPDTFGLPLHRLTAEEHKAIFTMAARPYLQGNGPETTHAGARAGNAATPSNISTGAAGSGQRGRQRPWSRSAAMPVTTNAKPAAPD